MLDVGEGMKRDYFYVWFMPLLWCGFTIVSCFHSGDEHGLFAYGSIAGTWVCFLHQFGSLKHALPASLAAGAVTLALFGLVLDLLRVKKRYWLILFSVLVILLFFWQFAIYGSIERMRNKHRYVIAVIVAVCNLSIYAATVLSIAGVVVRLLIGKASGKRVGSKPG